MLCYILIYFCLFYLFIQQQQYQLLLLLLLLLLFSFRFPFFADDSLRSLKDAKFSVVLKHPGDDASDCNRKFMPGWWYIPCHPSTLNGKYLNGFHEVAGEGINWDTWRGMNYSLKKTKMKIRPMT